MVWIAAATNSAPIPNQIRTSFLGKTAEILSASITGFGTPGAKLNLENGQLIFNCENRLCSMSLNQPNFPIKLITSTQTIDPGQSAWVTVDKKRYLLASIDRLLTFFKG